MILISYRRLHTEAQVRPTVSVPVVICYKQSDADGHETNFI